MRRIRFELPSAEVGGFFDMDRSRLIMPTGVTEVPGTVEEKKAPEKSVNGGGPGGGGGAGVDLDPIIIGLLGRLPKPGEVWPETDRKLWLELLSGSFKLIYKDKKDNQETVYTKTPGGRLRAHLNDDEAAGCGGPCVEARVNVSPSDYS